MMGPVFEKLSGGIKGITFAKVNVDDHQDLAAKFQIMSIPTLVVLKEGSEVDRIMGFAGEDAIRDFIQKHID